MTDGEKIIRLLDQVGKLMASGSFRKYELEYIKIALGKMIKATDNVLEKAKKGDE